MNNQTRDWSAAIQPGAVRVFGILQMDIARHSSIRAPDVVIPEVRDRLHRHVQGIVLSHGARELMWAGDGGAFLFLIERGSEYDEMVLAALQILDSLALFNWHISPNRIEVPLRLRVSCHRGELIWDPDLTNLHGKALNYFLKSERDLGLEDRVTLTEEVYDQLGERLRRIFKLNKNHGYVVGDREYSRQIYASPSVDQIARAPHSPEVASFPAGGELSDLVGKATVIEAMLAGGDTFYSALSMAVEHSAHEDTWNPTLKVLLRRSSTAAVRSREKFVQLGQRFNLNVEVRWYDYDYMLRGYLFDRNKGYFSYFLRENNRLSGRINRFLRVESGRSQSDDFLIAMFVRTFDAYYTAAESSDPNASQLPFYTEP